MQERGRFTAANSRGTELDSEEKINLFPLYCFSLSVKVLLSTRTGKDTAYIEYIVVIGKGVEGCNPHSCYCWSDTLLLKPERLIPLVQPFFMFIWIRDQYCEHHFCGVMLTKLVKIVLKKQILAVDRIHDLKKKCFLRN